MNTAAPTTGSTIFVKQALIEGKNILNNNAYNEVLLLLQFATGIKKESLIAHPDKLISEKSFTQFLHFLQRRNNGEPLAYIIEAKEFWSLSLKTVPGVLIPRPETELLVETTLNLLPKNSKATILDLGTGSGCIAIALATERPNAKIFACDNSEASIKVAALNAEKLHLDNVTFFMSNWFEAIRTQRFDLIVSNPPYIDPNDPYLQDEVRDYEPRDALLSKQDGLADIRRIIHQAPRYLKNSGGLLLEHGWQQGHQVRELFASKGFINIETFNDLQQHERATIGNYS